MFYTINDVSKMIGVSKMTIYRKLKVKELKSCVITKQGIQYLDDDGLTLLKKLINSKCKTDKDSVTDNNENQEIATDKNDYIMSLKSEIQFLKCEIQEKNFQMKELTNRLASEQELHKNTQILLKVQQDKKSQAELLALDEHFKDLDNRLLKVRERMEDRKQQNRPGIFNKIFNRQVL
jgi:hypothetical protein